MYLKKMYLIIISSLLVLLIGISIFQFVYGRRNTNELKVSYEQQITALEKVVSDLGPMGEVWTVSSKTIPGHGVTLEDLEPMEMLDRNIGKNYISDPNKIVGKYYKLAIMPGTPLTEDLFMNDSINNTSRQFEVVSSTIPVGLQVGDYIDYRFLLPNGEDYIAMSHKRVEGLYGKVITLYMTQEEIHCYQSLLLDYFINDGSKIYMTKYLEPSIQKPAQTYYPILDGILNLMSIDPNVTELIEESIIKKKRVIFDNSLKSIQEGIISKIATGRSSVQSELDAANSIFNQREQMEEQQYKVNSEDLTDALATESTGAGSISPSDELKQKDQTEVNDSETSKQDVPEQDVPKQDAPKQDATGQDLTQKAVEQNASSQNSQGIKQKMDGVVK